MSRETGPRADMADLIALAVFIAIVAALAVVGIRLGMLIAPRIDRLSESNEEVEGVDDD